MPGGRVLVVGAVNVDLVVAAARLPGPGQTVTGGDVARYPGGKGANQATAAARLGARVAFVGAVGPDDMGSEARAALAVEGIDLSGLAVTDRATGVALIVVDPSGENLIAVAPGANGEVRRRHVEAALERLAPGPRDVVLVSREIPADGVLAALEIGREAGSTTILNPAPADDLEASTLALVDILTPNETELVLLAGVGPAAVGPTRGGPAAVGSAGVGPAGDEPESLARRLLAGGLGGNFGGNFGGQVGGGGDTSDRDAGSRDALGGNALGGDTPGGGDMIGRGGTTGGGGTAGWGGTAGRRGPSWPAVVVTLGAAGALVVRIDGPALAVGAPDVTPLDTTGAGDAFNGALAAALADGLDLPEAVRRAVAAASLSTTRPGARGGMPTRSELEAFLGST